MFVELTVSDKETKKKYTLLYSSDQDGDSFLFTNEEDEGILISEKNFYDILNRYFKEEF